MKKNEFNDNFQKAMEERNFNLLSNEELIILLKECEHYNPFDFDENSEFLKKCIKTYDINKNMFTLTVTCYLVERFCELFKNGKILE